MPALPGDELKIRATVWNRLESIANSGDLGAAGGSDPLAAWPGIRVRARNANASLVDRFEPVVIIQPDLDPHTLAQAIRRPYFEVDKPTWPTSLGALAVAAEPIPAGAIGYVTITGLTPALVDVVNVTDPFASLDPGDITRLRSCNCGEVRIWKPGGTGERTCIVELGGRSQMMWRYQLTADHTGTATVAAKLARFATALETVDLFHASATFTLYDADQLIDDQVSTDIGYCIQVGNQFHAIQAPC